MKLRSNTECEMGKKENEKRIGAQMAGSYGEGLDLNLEFQQIGKKDWKILL